MPKGKLYAIEKNGNHYRTLKYKDADGQHRQKSLGKLPDDEAKMLLANPGLGVVFEWGPKNRVVELEIVGDVPQVEEPEKEGDEPQEGAESQGDEPSAAEAHVEAGSGPDSGGAGFDVEARETHVTDHVAAFYEGWKKMVVAIDALDPNIGTPLHNVLRVHAHEIREAVDDRLDQL
jgi:hypothetical protein